MSLLLNGWPPAPTAASPSGTTTVPSARSGLRVEHWFELDPTSGTPLAVSYGSSAATHGYAYTDALDNLAGMIDAAGTVAATYIYGRLRSSP